MQNLLYHRAKIIVVKIKSRVSNRIWTRTVYPNEPFHFGEPEPNLNQQKFYFSEPEPNVNPENCAQVNPNRTWTPNKSKNIFFPYPDAADAGTRTIRAVVNFNRINNFFFFYGRNE